jgi:RecA-family ATPase
MTFDKDMQTEYRRPRVIVDNEKATLPFIDMSTWDGASIPERQWAVDDRIPLKQTYLFTGNGAVGKSLVELQRAVAHVLGKPWLGMPVRQGPAIYLGAEDDANELHIRLAGILEYYEATFANVIAGGLRLLLCGRRLHAGRSRPARHHPAYAPLRNAQTGRTGHPTGRPYD